MARVYNFSAGPSILPEVVLKQAAEEMLDYKGSGQSVMEMSHRSKVYDDIIKEAEKDLRDLMNIPDNYKVLFLQGGASQQFAAIPMNLMKNGVADFIVTGQWAKKAWQEAQKYGKANKIASSEDKTFSYIPDCSDLPISEDADYVYICHNNTIYGTTFKELPNTKGKLLVADMSSDILSQPVNVEDYGLIFFGVQKNVGPAGVVVVIVREDLIRDDLPEYVPTMLKYKTQMIFLNSFLQCLSIRLRLMLIHFTIHLHAMVSISADLYLSGLSLWVVSRLCRLIMRRRQRSFMIILISQRCSWEQ